MSEQPPAISRPRLAVLEGLKAGAPASFNDEMRRAFLEDGSNIALAELEMDSLGEMEFCIAVELSTGATLSPGERASFASTDAIETWIRKKLDDAPATDSGASR